MSFDSELTTTSLQSSEDVTVEEFQDDERLQLEDLESARLQEHAAAIRHYVAAAEAETRETEVNSDEERDILLEIRDEITRQVREEMAGELAKYRGENLPGPLSPSGEASEEFLDGVDPKLRDAILQMRKLDKVLLRKMKKEKEVKRERIRQEQQLRQELKEMEEGAGAEGSKVAKDIRNNTLKFLALKPPPKHNAGVFTDQDSDAPPVFQTEYLGGTSKDENSSTPEAGAHASRLSDNKRGDSKSRPPRGETSQGKAKPEKDFIKRNIELAANASEVVAMTEEERARLDNLLEDIDTIPVSFEDTADFSAASNPFQVSVRPGDGYRMDLNTRSRMESIDSRLRGLMPEEEFEALVTPSLRSESAITQPSLPRWNGDFLDLDRLGEPALMEVREDRDLKLRLETIEFGLDTLQTDNETEIEEPYLDDDQLEDLLSQCARSLSRTGSELVSTTRSEAVSDVSEARSELEEMMQNPPRLDDDVLQKLLQEAREAGIGRHLGLQAIEEEGSEMEDAQHLVNGFDSDDDTPRADTEGISDSVASSWTNGPLTSDRITTPSTRRTSRSRESTPILPPALSQSRPGSVTEQSTSRTERLVLPDIEMFSQMTAPKKS